MEPVSVDQDAFARAVVAYRYAAPDLSLAERAFLDRFWDRVVRAYPTWLAPNLLSLAGGAACLAAYALDWAWSPRGLCEARPRALYLVLSALIFAYQTLDGTDGKQARRTKSGSALGELMDHGVDGVIIGLLAFVLGDALGVGLDSPVPWIWSIGAQMAFFASNLTLLHRGRQVFFPIDIMELELVMIVALALTGLFGPGVWREVLVPVPDALAPLADFLSRRVFRFSEPPPLGSIDFRFIGALGSGGGTVSNLLTYAFKASTPYRVAEPPPHVRAGAPGTGRAALAWQLFLVLAYGALAAFACARFASIEDPAMRHDALRALGLGSCFAFGDLTNRLLAMRVTHRPLERFPPAILLMAAFAAVSLVARSGHWWWAVAVAASGVHLRFFVSVSRRLARVLGIRVFRTRSPSA